MNIDLQDNYLYRSLYLNLAEKIKYSSIEFPANVDEFNEDDMYYDELADVHVINKDMLI